MWPLLMAAGDIVYMRLTPRPPMPSADMRNFRCQKIKEGSFFRGRERNQNLFSDLDRVTSDPTSEVTQDQKFRKCEFEGRCFLYTNACIASRV